MRDITKQDIEKQIEGKSRKTFYGWKVTTPQGRNIRIGDGWAMFWPQHKDILPGETEDVQEEVFSSTMKLLEDVWGGVPLPSRSQSGRKHLEEYCEAHGIETKERRSLPYTTRQMKQVFGDDAVCDFSFGKAGDVIQMPGHGEVVFGTSDGKETIKAHTGDGVVLQNAVRLLQACQGQVIVTTADQKLCLAVMAHAQVLNVPCSVELEKEHEKLVGILFGILIDIVGVCAFINGVAWQMALLDCLGLFVAGIFAMAFVERAMRKRSRRKARERGLALGSKFPNVNATSREAQNADAINGGWL